MEPYRSWPIATAHSRQIAAVVQPARDDLAPLADRFGQMDSISRWAAALHQIYFPRATA